MALVAFLMLGPVIKDHLNRIPFDSDAWRDSAQVDSDSPLRIRMIDDLLRDHDLLGETAESVEDLLGPGDETSKFADWDLVYWLGPERGLISIDSEWLVIRFDGNRLVSEYRVVTD